MKLWSLIMVLVATPALADSLYKPGQWPALASDYRAAQPGDSLTVMVLENATASNGVASGSRKSNRLRGNLDAGRRVDDEGLRLRLDHRPAGWHHQFHPRPAGLLRQHRPGRQRQD